MEWLEHHPTDSVDQSPFDLKSIQINPELTNAQIRRVLELIRKCGTVFEGYQNSLPKPFAAEPITLKFKPDARPQSIPQPRWTVAQKTIVTRWAEEGLRNGSLEPSNSAWSSWTPIGLLQPTVLPFGQKNSGTEAQGPYLLAAKKLSQVSNYVDDWLGYANDFETLFANFKAFLGVCLEYNITLNTTKTKFGFGKAQFFGFSVDAEGTRLADKHLCPIKNMVPPEDISELRRVLGLFVVSRKYLKDYALITRPLTDLLRGKQPVFAWG